MVAGDVPHGAEVLRGGGSLPVAPAREWLVVPLKGSAWVNEVALAPLEVWVGPGGRWAGTGAVFVGWIRVEPDGTSKHSSDT